MGLFAAKEDCSLSSVSVCPSICLPIALMHLPTGDTVLPRTPLFYVQIGSGYSKKELQEFNAKLVDHWQPFDKRNPPACIELASGFKEKPDAWIEPSKSAIVQVWANYRPSFLE